MSPPGCQLSRCSIILRRLLPLTDRRRTLEPNPEIDILSVRDPALHPSTPIRRRPQFAIRLANKCVVVPGPRDLSPAEARPNLESFRGRDREHCVCELGFETVKDGLSEPRGDVADDAGDRTPNRVVCFFCADDSLGRCIS